MIAKAMQRVQPVGLSRQAIVVAWLFVAMMVPELVLRVRPVVGIYVAAISFAGLLAVALRWGEMRKLAIAAAVWPLTLLLTAALPQPDIFRQTGVLYDTLLVLAAGYEYIFALDEPSTAYSLGKYYGLTIPLMIVVGEALGVLGFGLLRHQYAFRGMSLPLVATAAVLYAIAEEFYFRGLIQRQAAKYVQPIIAAAAAAVLYAAANIGQSNALPVVFALISGATLSAVYYFKPNIVLTSTLNATMKLTYLGLLVTFVLH